MTSNGNGNSNSNSNNRNGENDPLMAAGIPSSSEDKTMGKKRTFAWLSLRFQMPSRRKLEAFWKPGQRANAWCGLVQYCVESFVYFLGPVLICLASAIIGLLVYTYFTIIMDMLNLYYAGTWYGRYIITGHSAFVVYLMISVIWNYALCVCTTNTNGVSYNKVMREMATATGFVFPETPAEVEQFRKDYEDRMVLRMQCRRARAIEAANRTVNAIAQGRKPEENSIGTSDQSNNTGQVTQRKTAATQGQAVTTTIGPSDAQMRPWMVMGPLEWGFCNRTHQPKPPRAHYCHVSRGLVLCLDHYCPWMFSKCCVGCQRDLSLQYFVHRAHLPFHCTADPPDSKIAGCTILESSLPVIPVLKTGVFLFFRCHHKQLSVISIIDIL
jgi:hypothetical protein